MGTLGPGARPGGEHPARRRKDSRGLTDEAQAAICLALARGEFFDSAAILAGVNAHTALSWLQRGRVAVRDGRDGLKSEQKYVAFAAAVDKARAQADSRDLAMIALASKKDWKAAAWRLRARNPLRFGGGGPTAAVEVDEDEAVLPDGSTEKTTTTTVVSAATPSIDELTDEDYAAAARVLIHRRRSRQAAARGIDLPPRPGLTDD